MTLSLSLSHSLGRRRLLATLLSAAAVLPLVRLLPARAGVAEGFYMVNGWILTAADVEALGLGEAARRLA